MEKKTLIEILSSIPDIRQEAKVRHNLVDIIFIAIVATLANAEDWALMEIFATENEEWLRKYITLPNGIPSHDTIERAFKWIDPKMFLKSFTEWTEMVSEITKCGVVAIDGKTMRGTHDKINGKKALHIVSAWFSETGLVLGQVKTSEKSNEITAIPELLSIIDVTGCVVTIDAMGTQKDIAAKIIEKKADYVLALKGNQKLLHEDIIEFFKKNDDKNFSAEYNIQKYSEKDQGHGRIESRSYYISSRIDWLESREEWKQLNSIGMVVYTREENGEKKTEKRYYLCSIGDDAKKFAYAVRKHWGIESMHWSLDVSFNEDSKRTRKDNSPENLSLLHKFAYNILKLDKNEKKSLRARRYKAGVSRKYLEKVIALISEK